MTWTAARDMLRRLGLTVGDEGGEITGPGVRGWMALQHPPIPADSAWLIAIDHERWFDKIRRCPIQIESTSLTQSITATPQQTEWQLWFCLASLRAPGQDARSAHLLDLCGRIGDAGWTP